MTGAFALDEREAAILAAACRQTDDLAALEDAIAADGRTVIGSTGVKVHPAVSEARQGRIALSKLLGAMALPGDEDERPMTTRQRQAQKAANVRWAAVADRRERGAP